MKRIRTGSGTIENCSAWSRRALTKMCERERPQTRYVFGTTGEGGPSNLGTVFKLTPPANGQSQWTETVLHGFTGNDGAEPGASVIFRTPRVLFGTTASGGLSKEGTVFELTSEKRCDHDLLATNVGAARKCK